MLPSRQITFGRSQAQQPYQPPQAQYQPPQQQQVQQQNGLALPSGNPYLPQPAPSLALPGPSPLSNSYTAPVNSQVTKPVVQAINGAATAVATAAPSTPLASTPVPATPAPLTLEQQHITAVEGIVPTLQNIVATVNLDCRLDLKTIALHARNAEYNPKVSGIFASYRRGISSFSMCCVYLAFCRRHHAYP